MTEEDNAPREQLSSAVLPDCKKDQQQSQGWVGQGGYDPDDCGDNFIGSR